MASKLTNVNVRNLLVQGEKKYIIFQFSPTMKIMHTQSANSYLPSCLLKSCCSPLIMGLTRPLSLFPERSISSFPELWNHQISHYRSITPHINTHRDPKERGRCATLLVGRAEPLWTSPWRSKVVSGTLLRNTKREGVNHFSRWHGSKPYLWPNKHTHTQYNHLDTL